LKSESYLSLFRSLARCAFARLIGSSGAGFLTGRRAERAPLAESHRDCKVIIIRSAFIGRINKINKMHLALLFFITSITEMALHLAEIEKISLSFSCLISRMPSLAYLTFFRNLHAELRAAQRQHEKFPCIYQTRVFLEIVLLCARILRDG
jgi:hypothetical protein